MCKARAEFLAQNGGLARASCGQQQTGTVMPAGGVALATAADVVATFFLSLCVQMLPL